MREASPLLVSKKSQIEVVFVFAGEFEDIGFDHPKLNSLIGMIKKNHLKFAIPTKSLGISRGFLC